MNSTPFLSVCIITKNEEKFIAGCLESVKHIADEIVVVDSFSYDKTKNICLKYNVTFYERKWNNDYSAARNYAIEKANGTWVLFLDADERLIEGKKLLKFLHQEKSKKIGGILCERKDIFRHKENSKLSHYTVGIVRVFRNLPNIRFQYKIHEQINAKLIREGYQIKINKSSKIIHLVEQSTDTFLDKKQTYYLSLLNESLTETPNEPWLLYHKAKTLWYFKNYNEALTLFLFIAKNKKHPIDIRTSSYNQCALLASYNKEFKKAFNYVNKSLELIPSQSFAHSILYNLYYDINDFKNAIKSIKKVKTSLTKFKIQNLMPGDLYCYEDIKHYKIGCCYLALNKIYLAEKYFKRGITFNSKSSENYYGLSIISGLRNQKKKAIHYIKKCLGINPEWKEAKQLLELFLR